ncbi:ROK family protein [Pseudonocardia spinosispora]|uniref:ROK family protein n=1 Tax=Pseudonocardia spinosispora TaxID=103441 RepID=UPI00041F6124|nr:ROK family protein [Pseudonocardia spinosispora]
MTGPYVLAVDFGGTKAAVAAIDKTGRTLAAERIAMLSERGAEQALTRTLDTARTLIDQLGTDRLHAVGVASPGIVRPDGVLLAPNVPGWSQLRLRERFEKTLDATTVCATDVKAATMAEARWGQLRDVRFGLHLNLGTGIAVGALVDGTVLSGAHGAAGEIGYNLRAPDDPAGPHAGHAPLEQWAGGRAIGLRGRSVGGDGEAGSVFALARTDAAARVLVDRVLGEFAMHLTNAAILFDPARITVGGGLVRSADLVLPALAASLDRAVPFPPELVVARFAQDGALVGAAALAWEAQRS